MIRFYRHRNTGNIIATNDAIALPHAGGVACIAAPAMPRSGATEFLVAPRSIIDQMYYELTSEAAKFHNGAVWAAAWLMWGERPPESVAAQERMKRMWEEEQS